MAQRAALTLLLVMLAPTRALALHPDSLSGTLLEVRGAQVHVRLRCQVLSLLEVVPDLDADGDGRVDAAEVQARRVEILGYLVEHYGLFTGSARDLSGGVPLAATPLDVELLDAGVEEARGYRAGAVDARLVFQAPEPVGDLLVHSTLFADTSPGHIDYATIVWDAERTRTLALDRNTPRGRSDPSGRGAFGDFLGRGLTGLAEHWVLPAFALALALASRGRPRARLVVLAWPAAALAGFLVAPRVGLSVLSSEAGLVGAAAALSVAYLGVRGVEAGRRAAPALEALLFGVAHGAHLALAFGTALRREPVAWTATTGLLLGLLVPSAALGLVALARSGTGDARPPVALRVASAGLALAGMGAFLTRF